MSELLQALFRETHVKQLLPQMICGKLVANLLSMLSNTLKPSCILEVGTFTGYSALSMVEGLAPNGKLITIDINEELQTLQEKYFAASGHSEKIERLLGDARELIPELPGPFDLVFIDADKENYVSYYNMILPKLSQGGYILADNALWSNKVLDESETDKETRGLRAFNKLVQSDESVENILLPLEDGLMMIRKK